LREALLAKRGKCLVTIRKHTAVRTRAAKVRAVATRRLEKLAAGATIATASGSADQSLAATGDIPTTSSSSVTAAADDECDR
jgi:hypothetical protein